MLFFCDFIQVFIFTTKHHLKTCFVSFVDRDLTFEVTVLYLGYLLS